MYNSSVGPGKNYALFHYEEGGKIGTVTRYSVTASHADYEEI